MKNNKKRFFISELHTYMYLTNTSIIIVFHKLLPTLTYEKLSVFILFGPMRGAELILYIRIVS